MWLLYALLAMLCFGGMQLLFKQLTRMGVDSPVLLLFVFGFGTLLYLGHVALARPPVAVGGRALGLLGAAAALSYVGNLYMVRSLGQAPNPGYAIAVVGLQGLVVTLGAVAFFGSELSWLRAAGVALSVLGVALLALDA